MLEQAERGEPLSSGFPQCRPWTPPQRKSFPSLRPLLARMSHDLRTPLAAILANAEILAHASLSKEEQFELYEEIRLSVQLIPAGEITGLPVAVDECDRWR